LGRDISPEVPAPTIMDDRVKLRRRVMVTPLGVLHQRAIRYEDQIVFGNINPALLSALNPFEPACDLAIGRSIEDDIHYLRIELEAAAGTTKGRASS
jgi:hypothetical protein